MEEKLALVVPESHPFATREAVPLAEAAGEEFVWVHEAGDADHPLYAVCLAAGFAPRIVCQSGSAQGVLALVAAGLGIALLPRLAIEPREGPRVVPLAEPSPGRTLAVPWKEDALCHTARAFLKLCFPVVEGRGSVATPGEHLRSE